MGNKHSHRAGRQYNKTGTALTDSYNSLSSSTSSCIVPLPRPPDLKVLPDRVPGQRLRVTSNGQYLHSAGTLSGRQVSAAGNSHHQRLDDEEAAIRSHHQCLDDEEVAIRSHHQRHDDEEAAIRSCHQRYDDEEAAITSHHQRLQTGTADSKPQTSDCSLADISDRIMPPEINDRVSSSCHIPEYDLKNHKRQLICQTEQKRYISNAVYSEDRSFSPADPVPFEGDQPEIYGHNINNQFKVVDNHSKFPNISLRKEIISRNKQNYDDQIRSAETDVLQSQTIAPMVTDESSHRDEIKNNPNQQINHNKQAFDDSEPNSPSKFYFGMNPQGIGSNSICDGTSDSSVSSAEARTPLVSRIPSCTLHEFVRNLENSRRRQLSVNRQEIVSNSLVDIDYKLNQNDNYDATFDMAQGNTISMELRPSVPRKQHTIPTFSPRAAWKELDPEVLGSINTSSCTLASLSRAGTPNQEERSKITEKQKLLNHKQALMGGYDLPSSTDPDNKKITRHNRPAFNCTEMSSKSNEWIPAEDLESLQSGESRTLENSNLFVGTEQTCMSSFQSPAEVFSSRLWSNTHFVDDSEQKMYGLSMASVLRAFSGSKQHQIDENWLLSRSMPSFDVSRQSEPLADLRACSLSSIHSLHDDTELSDNRPDIETVHLENKSDCDNLNYKSKKKTKLSPIARYQRRFSYQSTYRMNQKQKSERETTKKIEEKEKMINEEQLAQQKFEEEFKKARKASGNGLKVQQLCKSFEEFQVNTASKSSDATEEYPRKVCTINNKGYKNHHIKGIEKNLSSAFNLNPQQKAANASKNFRKMPGSRLQSSSKLLNSPRSPIQAGTNESVSKPTLVSSPSDNCRQTCMKNKLSVLEHSLISTRQSNCPSEQRNGQKDGKKLSHWTSGGRFTDPPGGYHEQQQLYIPEFARAPALVHSPASSASGGVTLSSGYGSSTGEGRSSSAEQNNQSQLRFYRGGPTDPYSSKENFQPREEASFDAYQPGFYYKRKETAKYAAIPARLKRTQARNHQQTQFHKSRHSGFPRSASQHELRPRHNWWSPMMPRVGSELILYRSPSLRTHSHQISRYGGRLLPSYGVKPHENVTPSQWRPSPYQHKHV